MRFGVIAKLPPLIALPSIPWQVEQTVVAVSLPKTKLPENRSIFNYLDKLR